MWSFPSPSKMVDATELLVFQTNKILAWIIGISF